ncbi:MAG: NTP transferase domain-containing protein [Pusillimonas sp.]
MRTETNSFQGPLAPVALCVLAGGMSRRMGPVNKLLLDYQGQPLVRHVVRQALGANCGPVHVVTGYQSEQVEKALQGLPVQMVHNPDYAQGQAASVRVAASIDPQAALMVLLGDMPGVSPAIVAEVVQAWRVLGDFQARYLAVVRPRFDGKTGNPVLWGPGWLPRLRQLQGDEGARRLLTGNAATVTTVAVSSTGIFADIDQPSDLPGFDMRLPA